MNNPTRFSTLIRWCAVVFLLALLGMVMGASPILHAQEDIGLTYERYDVDIIVATDGTFRVREIQQIRFEDTFRSAFADIPFAYTDGITDVVVYEDETPYELAISGNRPGSYRWEENGDNISIEWFYNPTRSGTVKTFVLEYTVAGALWVYDNEYTLEWRAIPGDRSGIPIESSTVTVQLPIPPPADALRYAAIGRDYTATDENGVVRFDIEPPINDGTTFQVLIGFPKEGITAEKQPYQIAEESVAPIYRLEAVDTDIFIGEDGTVTVEEQHRIALLQGLIGEGERTIPLAYTDGITNVQVFELDQPLQQSISLCEDCFTFAENDRNEDWIRYDSEQESVLVREREAGQAEIRWRVPSLVPGESTTFQVRYEVQGLIATDASEQRFDWTPIFDTRRSESREGERVDLQSTPAIESATVRLHLPAGVDPSAVQIDGGRVEAGEAEGVLLVTHDGAIAPGDKWELQVRLPANATTATAPLWQQNLDAARQTAQEVADAAAARFAQQQLGLGAGGVLALVGGLVGTTLLWFTRGRDKEVPLQADYLSEPPSALPPGIVAYLLDEEPTTKGVMASLFHLATLGLLQITFDAGVRFKRNSDVMELSEEQPITKADGSTVIVPRHLVLLYNRLASQIPTDQSIGLQYISTSFMHALPRVYEQMGNEASQFFSEVPTAAVHRWKSVGQGLILLGGVGGALAYFVGRPIWGDVALWIPIALLIVGVALLVVSRWMAQKTILGAEEAGKWLAFKRYLQNLKQYGGVAEAQTILDEYFAYAVAFDIEKVVLEQATALGVPAPRWTLPTTMRRDPTPPSSTSPTRGQYGTRPTPILIEPRSSTPGTTPAPSKPWTVQGGSDNMANAIQDADSRLSALLNQAGGADTGTTPFDVVQSGVQGLGKATMSTTKTTFEILGDILEASASGGGGGGYSGGSSSGSRSWGSRSSSSSRSSSRSSGSSSRRSGGGGSRGFR